MYAGGHPTPPWNSKLQQLTKRRRSARVNRTSRGKVMKLSIEAKVAAAVATAFVALTVGAIGQEHSGGQTGGLNGHGPTNNPAFKTYLSQQAYNRSLAATNAEADKGN